MASDIIDNILTRVHHPELVRVLVENLSGTELNSLLLEVFHRRTTSLSAPGLLNHYQINRFVKPVDLPVIKMKRIELEVLEFFESNSFPAIELSPVTVLGACSVVGPAHQNKILTALRGTEVVADSTNAIALHAADLKQSRKINEPDSLIWMKCSNIQQQLRTQTISEKGFRPHFKIGCVVSCGLDHGGFSFEKLALLEHMQVMNSLFLNHFKVDQVVFRILRRNGYHTQGDALPEAILSFVAAQDPSLTLFLVDAPETANHYYKGIQYKTDISLNGKVYEIADGGFVDWTQKLLQNRKERMLSTGFGLDLMYRILSGEL